MPRLLVALVVLLGSAGCASVDAVLDRPPNGPYRIPGLAPDPMASSADEGTQRYTVPLAAGRVQYVVEVAMDAGLVRVRTVVRNAASAPVRYRVTTLALTDRGGEPLTLRGVEERPSQVAAAEERRSDAYRDGLRIVAPGEKLLLERRFALSPAGKARSGEHLSLADEVEAGDLTAPLRLALSRVQ